MTKGHDKKVGQSVIGKLENKFKSWIIPKIPLWLESNHLTMLTVLWSIIIIVSGYLAQYSLHWFWVSSFFIAMQWLTDTLDGELGRQRGTGLIRWGFYMDHFLDYIFLCAIMISYVFTLPNEYWIYSLLTLIIFGAFMVNSFLYFGATEKFKIEEYGIGPTEIRIVFIAVNTLAIFFYPSNLAIFLPWIFGAATLGLIYIVFKSQKEIWAIDMENKKKGIK